MKSLPISLVELTPRQKRRRSASIISGGKSSFSLEEILDRLRRIRLSSSENLEAFCHMFQQSARRYSDVDVVFAEDAAAAVAYLNKAVRGTRELLINRSTTVNELRPGLEAAGYTLMDTYLPQFSQSAELENRIEHYWQLLALPDKAAWDSFQCTDSSVLSAKGENAQLKDVVALLGANAAGAADGSIFLLQHSDNIATVLRQAKKLIFLLGIEKIVADRDAALFQAKCAGFFGMESVLLDLEIAKDKQPGPDILEHAPEAKNSDREIHIILLDNGRSKLIDSPLQELLYCISCKACLKRCPTYRFFGQGLGRHPKDYLWSFLAKYNASLELCVHCQSCYVECPLDINIPMMIARAKATRPARVFSWQSRALATAPSLAGTARLMAPLANAVLKNKMSRLGLDWFMKIDRRRQLPEWHATNLEDWFHSRKSASREKKKVAYYAGCFASYFDTEVGRAAIEILERNGFAVTLVRNKCCGIAKIASGDLKNGLKDARSLLQELVPLAGQDIDILVSCPSCGLALKKEYPLLLNSEDSIMVAQRIYDLSEYLMALQRKNELDTDFPPMPLLVAYHNPCHLKAQGIEQEPVELMRLIPGLKVEVLDRGCCGMAGTFGLKSQHYNQSMEISAPLFAEIEKMAPQLVVTDCAGCQMQLKCGPQKQVVHPLILLQKAYSEERRK
jgi:anaerobic glycerol-3-phosphate dehydrogenase C subunit